jgi:hypothetical protein
MVRDRVFKRRLRFSLLVFYLLISIVVAWRFIEAEYVLPLLLLFSWGYALGVVATLGLRPLVPFAEWGAQWIVVYLVAIALYLFGLMKLNNLLRRVNRFPIPIIPIAIHLGGFLLCLMFYLVYELQEKTLPLLSWIISSVLVLSYLLIDWRLALKTEDRAEKPPP